MAPPADETNDDTWWNRGAARDTRSLYVQLLEKELDRLQQLIAEKEQGSDLEGSERRRNELKALRREASRYEMAVEDLS